MDNIFNKSNNYGINPNLYAENKNIKNNSPDEQIDEFKMIIGVNEKKKDIYIPKESRFNNTLVLGTKATGKTRNVLSMMIEQDFKNKKAGATVIVTKKEMSYNLYTLAKKYKRKITFLKPSINNEISNKLLWENEYNYDYINEYIINYKEAIKRKEIVIIDMEILKYKSEGLRAVAMLLLQLQLDMQETDITSKTPHFLYIDDAYYYLPFIEYLLNYSDSFNLGITLFMQSRSQFIKNNKDYSNILDNNIRSTLLLNSLTGEDVEYYSKKFYEHNNPNNFYNRKVNTFMYETIDSVNKRKCGISEFKFLSNDVWDELEKKSKNFRKKLLKEKRKTRELQMLQQIKEKQLEESNLDTENKEASNNSPCFNDFKNEPTPIDVNILEEDGDDNLEEDENVVITENDDISNDLSNSTIDEKKDKEFKQDKISENIRADILSEEKEHKRKISSQIFNKLNKEIDYCDDNFDFHFE